MLVIIESSSLSTRKATFLELRLDLAYICIVPSSLRFPGTVLTPATASVYADFIATVSLCCLAASIHCRNAALL